MANIKSAIKRIDLSKKQTERNKPIRTASKTAIRKFEEALAAGEVEQARALLQDVDKKLKKAVSKNVIHKNTASRKLGRLTQKLNKLS
ncbi:MAG: 30S ribosomal protein S20 [Tissierellia bacterium]|nr:30S ribosomal protein S20 [Tissierellia bacterium]